jgi:hypothetical protein
MNYEVALVNPKTSEQKTIVVELSTDQASAAKSSPCLNSFVQAIAWPDIPAGFLPVGNGVRPVTLQ